MPDKSARYRVQVLDRAIAILNVLTSSVDNPTQTDLAAKVRKVLDAGEGPSRPG